MPSSTSSDRRDRGDSDDTGQAVVEFALALPLVCLLLLGVVQVAVVVRGQLLVDHLAREAARSAAPSAAPGATAQASVASSGVPDVRADVGITPRAVRVTVRMVQHTDVPLIGLLIPDITLDHSVVMSREPP